jgi:Uma2 family endonuclease
MVQPAGKLMAYAEYLAVEAESDVKHEFCNGAIVAMAGGTLAHSHLATRIAGIAMAALEGRSCRPFNSDAKIRIPKTTLATYPDLSIVCGPIHRDAEDPNAIVNPTLLLEVLSPGTEAYDRGEKFAHYRELETLEEYVLVSSEETRIEVFRRNADRTWTFTSYGPGATLPLRSVDIELSVDRAYEGVDELRAKGA